MPEDRRRRLPSVDALVRALGPRAEPPGLLMGAARSVIAEARDGHAQPELPALVNQLRHRELRL